MTKASILTFVVVLSALVILAAGIVATHYWRQSTSATDATPISK